MKYLVIQRRNAIKALLVEKGSVTINEIVDQFGVSIETVRRDFDALHEEGFLNKIYGGAALRRRTSTSLSEDLLRSTFLPEKTRIAARAAQFVKNHDTIFLDSSDTVFHMCSALMEKEITVLTNSFRVIEKLSASQSIRLIGIGGLYCSSRAEFTGAVALSTLQQFQFDRVFITCRSFDFQHGLGTTDEEQALFKKTVITHAQQVNLLADHSRFDRVSFVRFADFEDIHNIFTDHLLSQEWKDFFDYKSVSYYECPEEPIPSAQE